MATFGNASTPNYAWVWWGINSYNQCASQFTVPAAATITSVNVYMAGHWASVNAQAVLWDAPTGNVIRNSGTFSAAAGSSYQGGQAWHYTNVTAYNANQGDSVWIGFWRDPAGRAEHSLQSTGGYHVTATAATTGSFASNFQPGNPNGTMGAYCVYTGNTGGGGGGGGGGGSTSRINLWNGTAWAQKPLEIWNGTAWVQKPLERWSGTAWG